MLRSAGQGLPSARNRMVRPARNQLPNKHLGTCRAPPRARNTASLSLPPPPRSWVSFGEGTLPAPSRVAVWCTRGTLPARKEAKAPSSVQAREPTALAKPCVLSPLRMRDHMYA